MINESDMGILYLRLAEFGLLSKSHEYAGGLAGEQTSSIEVREFYNNYMPPRYVLRLVARLLSRVPAKYTKGLDCVVLTNQSGAPRRDRIGKIKSRKRRQSRKGVFGLYHSFRPSKPPWIELYVGNIVQEISYHPLVPFGRTACFGMVLFHEIGHHVHATVRPEFREKEDVADGWGKKLLQHYVFQHYWYVPKPAWKILGRILKEIANEL